MESRSQSGQPHKKEHLACKDFSCKYFYLWAFGSFDVQGFQLFYGQALRSQSFTITSDRTDESLIRHNLTFLRSNLEIAQAKKNFA